MLDAILVETRGGLRNLCPEVLLSFVALLVLTAEVQS